MTSEAYTVLWSKERCRWLERVGDRGPLRVVFGGPHTSMPSLERVQPGDRIFPIAVDRATLLVLACLRVRELVPPEQFVAAELGIQGGSHLWDTRFDELKKTRPEVGHRVPHSCAETAAVGDGSTLRFDRYLPLELMQSLRFGPVAGREKPPKGLTEHGLKHNFSFMGHVRRLSHDSARVLQDFVAASDTPSGR